MRETERLRSVLLGIRPTDRLWGWLGPIIIATLAGVMRFVNLGHPKTIVFDETYYVKEAYSMLRFGYERQIKPELTADGATPNADALFAAGNMDIFGNTADFVVHPPLGKWVIAIGIKIFGVDNPFGWRFSVAALGTLAVLILARVARRMFGSTTLGMVAGLLLTFDGIEFVHSRTGILDMVIMFFALVGFAALVLDRDRSREILARRLGALREEGTDPRDPRLVYGPFLGVRPWRWVAGLSLGACAATKWSGLFFLAVFGLMTVAWDLGARRAAGLPGWRRSFWRDAPLAFVAMVPIAVATYLASWSGWFATSGGWDRNWAKSHPATGIAALVPDALRSLWQDHAEMWHFNTTLTTHHDYMSNPWGWLVMARPTSFYYEGPKRGVDGCTVEACSKAITDSGTISLWWASIPAIAICLFMWLLRRDWRAGAALSGLAAGYLPWFLYQERTIYTFYAVAFVPWVVLAVTYVCGLVLGRSDASPRRRRVGVIAVGSFVVLTAALFVFWWPVHTAEVIPYDQWRWRMWFPSWV